MQNDRYSDNRHIGYENHPIPIPVPIHQSYLKHKNVTQKFLICCYDMFYKIVYTCIYETDWLNETFTNTPILPMAVPMLPIPVPISMPV